MNSSCAPKWRVGVSSPTRQRGGLRLPARQAPQREGEEQDDEDEAEAVAAIEGVDSVTAEQAAIAGARRGGHAVQGSGRWERRALGLSGHVQEGCRRERRAQGIVRFPVWQLGARSTVGQPPPDAAHATWLWPASMSRTRMRVD